MTDNTKTREAFAKLKQHERHCNAAESRYWCDQYRMFAEGLLKQQAAQAEQYGLVVGEPVAYSLSTDYAKLMQFLIAGNDAAGFVTTNDYMNGDVVGITRRGPYQIHIGVRGYSHASIYPFNAEDGSEESVFIKACEFSGLKWIEPTNSIPATELERLRECEAVLAYVRRVLPMEKWADDSRRMIDAAIAQGKGE